MEIYREADKNNGRNSPLFDQPAPSLRVVGVLKSPRVVHRRPGHLIVPHQAVKPINIHGPDRLHQVAVEFFKRLIWGFQRREAREHKRRRKKNLQVARMAEGK